MATKEAKAQQTLEYKAAARSDGTEAHNLEVAETPEFIHLRISKTKPAMLSSNGKPMVSCSKGFISIGSDFTLSLNAMDKRKR